MHVFWCEQFRLAMQTTQMACRQCQLLTGLALFTPASVWAFKQRESDDK
jgi:hypothetical protein